MPQYRLLYYSTCKYNDSTFSGWDTNCHIHDDTTCWSCWSALRHCFVSQTTNDRPPDGLSGWSTDDVLCRLRSSACVPDVTWVPWSSLINAASWHCGRSSHPALARDYTAPADVPPPASRRTFRWPEAIASLSGHVTWSTAVLNVTSRPSRNIAYDLYGRGPRRRPRAREAGRNSSEPFSGRPLNYSRLESVAMAPSAAAAKRLRAFSGATLRLRRLWDITGTSKTLSLSREETANDKTNRFVISPSCVSDPTQSSHGPTVCWMLSAGSRSHSNIPNATDLIQRMK